MRVKEPGFMNLRNASCSTAYSGKWSAQYTIFPPFTYHTTYMCLASADDTKHIS